MSSQSRLPERAEIDERYTWNTESIFPSPEAWEAEMEAIPAELEAMAQFRGRLSKGPDVLADWLERYYRLVERVGKIAIYANCRYSVDATDQAEAARESRARSLQARAYAATAFAEPEMLAIGTDTLLRWAKETPALAIYDHYFQRLAHRAEHIRSPEVEELLGEVSDPFASARSIHGILADADLAFAPARSSTGEELPVAQGTIDALETHPDREVRRTAWENYADAHLALKNAMAACLQTGVRQNIFRARARNYGSALEAALGPNRIPTDVYYNVINTFRQYLPTWHRYWRMRRQALGLDKLQPYDVKAPLSAGNPVVPYDQAVDWICRGMAPLGDNYVNAMRRGLLQDRWVDVYPNRGKRSGAFSSGKQGTLPFVFMSYTDDIFSLSTLAHELGHSMHSYLTWEAQPPVYSNYSIFVAEVASNFNQAMVRDYLLRTLPERAYQLALIEEAMSNFHRYFFIMPTLARFELEIHQRVERGQALTADSMIALLADLFGEGFGDEVEMDVERVGITWAEFHIHLYMNFYVYQYTTGISAAHALLDQVQDGREGAVERYLNFLQSGGSVYPLDALQTAGVDLTSPEPIARAFEYMGGLVDRLETLLNAD